MYVLLQLITKTFDIFRHPLQELCVNAFVPNDTCLGADHSKMKILTGANASGKSVYLTQVCLVQTQMRFTRSNFPLNWCRKYLRVALLRQKDSLGQLCQYCCGLNVYYTELRRKH